MIRWICGSLLILALAAGFVFAQGNVATEDVVYLLEREGIATGVDLDALIETARWLASVLERPVPGRVQRAGRWP